MSLKTVVKDRVSSYPGRVKLTPVAGQTNTYDLVRADQPTEAGTPLTAALFNHKADVLTDNVNIYVSKSGNNSNADGTSAKPYSTIQAALDSIPKNLGGHLVYVHVGAGTYEEAVTFEYFDGGRVILTGAAGAAITIKGLMTIRKCVVNIDGIALTMLNGYIYITECGLLNLVSSATLTCSGAVHAVYARYGSCACLLGVATANNTTSSAFRSGENSTLYLYETKGTGNTLGLYAIGGIIYFRINDVEATTAYSTAHGGKIYNGAQTSTPKY